MDIINLGQINVSDWRDEMGHRGYDTNKLICITWHTAKPVTYIAVFRVRPHDPLNYICYK